jgi:hypothetical protein
VVAVVVVMLVMVMVERCVRWRKCDCSEGLHILLLFAASKCLIGQAALVGQWFTSTTTVAREHDISCTHAPCHTQRFWGCAAHLCFDAQSTHSALRNARPLAGHGDSRTAPLQLVE